MCPHSSSLVSRYFYLWSIYLYHFRYHRFFILTLFSLHQYIPLSHSILSLITISTSSLALYPIEYIILYLRLSHLSLYLSMYTYIIYLDSQFLFLIRPSLSLPFYLYVCPIFLSTYLCTHTFGALSQPIFPYLGLTGFIRSK